MVIASKRMPGLSTRYLSATAALNVRPIIRKNPTCGSRRGRASDGVLDSADRTISFGDLSLVLRLIHGAVVAMTPQTPHRADIDEPTAIVVLAVGSNAFRCSVWAFLGSQGILRNIGSSKRWNLMAGAQALEPVGDAEAVKSDAENGAGKQTAAQGQVMRRQDRWGRRTGVTFPAGGTDRVPETADHRNSFHFARFVAASMVLFSHHFPLSGLREPIVPVIGNTWGGAAVSIFFAMSGFLIFQSLQRSNNVWSYFAARITRLIPNLLFALILTSTGMMVWFSNYENLLGHVHYVLYNSTVYLHGVLYKIPGVLEDRPNTSVNGSLWTLQYEFFMYCFLFAVFLLRKRLVPIALVISIAGFWLLSHVGSDDAVVRVLWFNLLQDRIGQLGITFLSGSLLAFLWPVLSRRRIIVGAIAAIAMIVSATTIGKSQPIFSLGLATLVVLFCTSRLFAGFERFGDASYGIYILAFPIQQLTIIAVNGFWASMAVAFLVTTALGYSTWHAFEKRALGYRHRLAKILGIPFEAHGSVRSSASSNS